jgi:hypothetical protein
MIDISSYSYLMALLLQPFIYMIQPREHELARVNEEESQGKGVRVNREEQRTTPKQPIRDVYIIT